MQSSKGSCCDHRTTETGFNLDRAILAMAGLFILASLAIGYWVTPWAFLFTGFVGLNMFQAAFTGFCPAAIVFAKCGMKSGCAFRGR